MVDVLALAAAVASQPTAPLLEHLPLAAVRALAAELGLPTRSDEVGNLVVGEGSALVLVAHLDHPSMVVDAVDGATLRLTFRGGVRAGVARPGTPVVLHRPGVAEPQGRAVLTAVTDDTRLRGATAEVVEGGASVAPGWFAPWDVAGYEERDGRITARACDDLLGVAAGLAALGSLAPADRARASLLCTRGEEMGWLGALEAVRLGTIPADATVLSLECSKALVNAPQGGGVIVRVGDLRSVFDPGLTAAVWARATALGTTAQRRLMDGGSCEATVFCAAGLRSSGLALPLAGYHNQPDDPADDGGGPVPESVLVADLEAEVALLRALCEDPPGPPDGAWLDRAADEARTTLAAHPL